MDEILELIKKSSRSADEVAECIIKHGDAAIDAIRKYGDDAVDAIVTHGDDATRVIGKYGDDAVDRLKKGKTPDEIEKELGNTGGEITSGLTKEKIQEIINTPKGSRPDPSTYLSNEYINAHLEQFDDGASIIMTKEQYMQYVDGRSYIGIPDDGTQFVMPKSYCDDIANIADGNISVYETKLGFDTGHFEDGANSLWIPGGYTSGGIPEAVTDLIPNISDNITVTEIK